MFSQYLVVKIFSKVVWENKNIFSKNLKTRQRAECYFMRFGKTVPLLNKHASKVDYVGTKY